MKSGIIQSRISRVECTLPNKWRDGSFGEKIVLSKSLLETELVGKALAAGALSRIIVGVLMLEAQTMLGTLDRPLELCCVDV